MDIEPVVRAQHGDQGAFTAIVDAMGGRLHAIAFGIVRDRELARDATQRALLSAWRDLPRLREADRFEAWLYRILVRACRSEARRAARWMPGLAGSSAFEPTVSDDIGPVLDRDQLDRGFRRLSVEHRAVLVLTYHADLAPADVARALGIPPGTAHSRIHRALRTLRAALEADARAPLPGRPAALAPTLPMGTGLDIGAARPLLTGNTICENATNMVVAAGTTPPDVSGNEVCANAPAAGASQAP